jgi:hypothetical protein
MSYVYSTTESLSEFNTCEHCGENTYHAGNDSCENCYHPDDHKEIHDGNCDYLCSNCNSYTNDYGDCPFCDDPDEDLDQHGFVAPGLFSIKDDGSNNHPAVIQHQVDNPTTKEDVGKHLKEHYHPGLSEIYESPSELSKLINENMHDQYQFDSDDFFNEDTHPDLTHYHNHMPYGAGGVSVEDLIGGQPHPNMHLPMEAISDQSKINHYTHEHGYLPENNNDNITPENMKTLDKMHEDYHKSADPEDEWSNAAWKKGPARGIALPHEHWDTIEGDPKNLDKNEELLSSMNEQNEWFKNKKNRGGIERNSNIENIITFAKRFWNPKDDITLEEHSDKFFDDIEKI